MPTKPRPEDVFIEAFLSTYEDLSWADADKDWVDQRKDGGGEMLAKRRSDGKTLAIEHTVAQPFVGEIEDYRVFFEPSFLKLEGDKSLIVADRWIQVSSLSVRSKATGNRAIRNGHNCGGAVSSRASADAIPGGRADGGP